MVRRELGLSQDGPPGRVFRAAVVIQALLSSISAHLTLSPGRFFAHEARDIRQHQNATCATKFALNGSKFDVSALVVDVGGWVAENDVDKYHCEWLLKLEAFSQPPASLDCGCVSWPELDPRVPPSDCLNVCAVVSSERNCICYPCGKSAAAYPSSQVVKDPTKGETCKSYLGELAAASWSVIGLPSEKKGLVLRYGLGEDGKATELSLLCDPGSTGLDTGPKFMGSESSVYRFQWKTSAGCPLS